MNATSAPSARPRLLVDEPRPARLQLRQRRANVIDPQRDVVQARAALVDVLRDRRVGGRRLRAARGWIADRDEVRAHALRCDLFGRLDLEAQRIAIKRQRGVEIATAMPM